MTARIGLQLYTVRDALAADPRAALERVAGIGFRSVELFGLARYADAYATGIPDAGLTASSAHVKIVGPDLQPAPDFAASLDLAGRLGVPTVVEPSTPAALWSQPDAVARVADILNDAAELAADRGIRVGYHNHDGEIRGRIGGTSGLEHLVARLDPRVVLEIDAYWVVAGGDDVATLTQRSADRVRFLHVKDGTLQGDVASQPAAGTAEAPAHLAGQVPAGEGVVPLGATLAAATALEHAIVEFDEFAGDVFAAIAASRNYVLARGCVA